MDFNDDLIDWLNESNGYFLPLDAILAGDEINLEPSSLNTDSKTKTSTMGKSNKRKKVEDDLPLETLPPEERKKALNKGAAARYRARKKAEQDNFINSIKLENDYLKAENARLTMELDRG